MWACIKKTAVYKPKRRSSLGTELADCFVLDFSLADSFILDFQTWTVEIKFLLFKLLSLWDFVNGWLSWLIQAANNNDIWWYMCFNARLSIRPTRSFPHCVRKPVLSVFVCTAALRISTSFQIPCIWVNIQYLFFSFWLTSLCITGIAFFFQNIFWWIPFF